MGCASQSLCGSWESAERQPSMKPEKGHYASGGGEESDWQESKERKHRIGSIPIKNKLKKS